MSVVEDILRDGNSRIKITFYGIIGWVGSNKGEAEVNSESLRIQSFILS